jgi:hypothetical protein
MKPQESHCKGCNEWNKLQQSVIWYLLHQLTPHDVSDTSSNSVFSWHAGCGRQGKLKVLVVRRQETMKCFNYLSFRTRETATILLPAANDEITNTSIVTSLIHTSNPRGNDKFRTDYLIKIIIKCMSVLRTE